MIATHLRRTARRYSKDSALGFGAGIWLDSGIALPIDAPAGWGAATGGGCPRAAGRAWPRLGGFYREGAKGLCAWGCELSAPQARETML
jgi:hypothetical protein